MQSDAELMTAAVVASPLDFAARCALADALATDDGDTESAKLVAGITALAAHMTQLTVQDFIDAKLSIAPPVFTPVYVSDKWCRIVRHDASRDPLGGHGSAAAFVALKNNRTKTLGTVCAGDIHKPASWKAPARVARGSVLLPNFGNAISGAGVVYYIR